MQDYVLQHKERNLPKGWVWTKLENCVEILDNQRIPVNKDERKKRSGKIPYFGATGQAGWIDDFIFDEELVLLGEDGVPFLDFFKNKAYIIRGKSWVNNHAHVLKIIPEFTHNSFVCHYLNFFNYTDYVTGTTRLKLNQTSMRKIPFRLAPLNEQKRIATKIEELFLKLNSSKESLEKTKYQISQYYKSLLNFAFEGKVTEGWRKKFNIPYEWKKMSLDDLSLSNKNGFTGRPTEEPPGTPRLGIISITRSNSIYVDEKKHKFIEISSSEIEKYLLKNNDILVCRQNGNKHFVGKFAVYRGTINPIIFSDSLIRFRVNVKEILPTFLAFFMSSDKGRKLIDPYCSTTAGNYSINSTNLKKLEIHVPKLEEQKIIVSKIEEGFAKIKDVEKIIELSLKNTVVLKSRILKSAFEGKLVKQNPKDEPANVLLEKIHAKSNETWV